MVDACAGRLFAEIEGLPVAMSIDRIPDELIIRRSSQFHMS